jgi:hypothetical protein
VPQTYYHCTLAADTDGFVVCGLGGRDQIEASTDESARAVARTRWPDAAFVLTTFRKIFGQHADQLGKEVDAVIMAVYKSSDDIVGYIIGSVHGPFCVPFAAKVWPDAIDQLSR